MTHMWGNSPGCASNWFSNPVILMEPLEFRPHWLGDATFTSMAVLKMMVFYFGFSILTLIFNINSIVEKL